MVARNARFPTLNERTIQSKVSRAKKQKSPLYGTYTVDPRSAARILSAHNKINRTVSSASVESIADDMKNGQWVGHSGQFIKFSDDGSLLDGQHRLHAIVKAGMSVPMEFAFGIPEKARIVTDTGRPRTFGDNIAMGGTKYACALSATTRLLKQFLENPHFEGVQFKNAKLSSSTLANVLAAHPGLFDAIEVTKGNLLKQQLIHSYSAFAYYVFSQTKYKNRVKEFFEKLSTGESMTSDNPIMAFRNRIARERQILRSQTNKEIVIGMLFQTWNAFIKGEKVQRCFSPKVIPRVEGLKEINGKTVYSATE